MSNDGGQAVACLSLRDYFAAKAMAALIVKLGHPHTVAPRAYEYADAMLKAREAK